MAVPFLLSIMVHLDMMRHRDHTIVSNLINVRWFSTSNESLDSHQSHDVGRASHRQLLLLASDTCSSHLSFRSGTPVKPLAVYEYYIYAKPVREGVVGMPDARAVHVGQVSMVQICLRTCCKFPRLKP